MGATLDLTADELLTTTRAVRKRLDFDKPVPLELVRECIDIATQAPTGSNQQGWHWYVVTDKVKRAALGDLYNRAFELYKSMPFYPGTISTRSCTSTPGRWTTSFARPRKPPADSCRLTKGSRCMTPPPRPRSTGRSSRSAATAASRRSTSARRRANAAPCCSASTTT